jgi:hypothetical protein
MSDAEKAYQATPASTLEEQIMNPCIAKNEREWWAAAEIERLRAALEDVASTFDDTYNPNSREGRLGRLARAALSPTASPEIK